MDLCIQTPMLYLKNTKTINIDNVVYEFKSIKNLQTCIEILSPKDRYLKSTVEFDNGYILFWDIWKNKNKHDMSIKLDQLIVIKL